MGTTADKLNRLMNTREGIKREINRAYGNEEIGSSDAFRSYVQKLEEQPFYINGFLDGTIESARNSSVTSIGYAAFNHCPNLTSVSFPNVISIGDGAFETCKNLTDASFPKATSIGISTFYSCLNLASVSFPNVASIGSSAFSRCQQLTSASFPNAASIGDFAFSSCYNLTTIYVGTNTSTVCALSSTSAFNGCGSLANIYVPANLVNSYKSATNWSDSSLVNKIKAAPNS